MFVEYIVGFSGLIASALFIYGLKAMSSPVTAVSGIVTAGYGMIFVVAATFLNLLNVSDAVRPHLLVNIGLGVLALILGGAWAGLRGRSVQMTAMPQMVALFNGMGGGSAACLAAVELLSDQPTSPLHLTITVIGALIGCISLTGSIIAWAKLDGRMKKPVRFKGQRLFNGLLFLASVILGAAAILYYGTPNQCASA